MEVITPQSSPNRRRRRGCLCSFQELAHRARVEDDIDLVSLLAAQAKTIDPIVLGAAAVDGRPHMPADEEEWLLRRVAGDLELQVVGELHERSPTLRILVPGDRA
jgi:hypothetical protein